MIEQFYNHKDSSFKDPRSKFILRQPINMSSSPSSPSSLSALDASSYQHPIRGGPFEKLREATVLAMMEQGIEYNTLSENPLSWADDQDPFGHVMTQAYAHYSGNCFIRVLESFQANLKDEFPRFMSGKAIGPMTNKTSLKINRVVKYPDTVSSIPHFLKFNFERLMDHGDGCQS